MAIFRSGRTDDTHDEAAAVVRRAARNADPSLGLKRRARQRLVGATVLALAAVIVLPMLLDAQPRPVKQDLRITLAKQDTASSTTAVSPIAAPSQVSNTATVASATSAAAASTSEAKTATNVAGPDSTGSAGKAIPTDDAGANRAGIEHSAPATKREATKDVKDTKDNGNRALALLEGRNDSASKSSRYLVQIGAYSSEENVKDLRARLKAVGVATYTERVKTSSGERVRLRAGPFASREQAEAARAKIASHGAAGAALVNP